MGCCEPTWLTLVGQRWMLRGCTNCLERQTRAGDSPVVPFYTNGLSKLKYHGARETPWEAGPTTVQGELLVVTDSAQYREGTVKSTPARGVKEYLKPTASMQ